MSERVVRKKTSQSKTVQTLCDAAPKAADFLVKALDNDELSMKERAEIAKEILNRGFGKQTAVLTENSASANVLKIVLGDDVKALSE